MMKIFATAIFAVVILAETIWALPGDAKRKKLEYEISTNVRLKGDTYKGTYEKDGSCVYFPAEFAGKVRSLNTSSGCIWLYGKGKCDDTDKVPLIVGFGGTTPLKIKDIRKLPEYEGQNYSFLPCD